MTWADTIRRLEDLGFTTVFLPDHFDEQFGPFTALAAAAAASPTITLGTLVLDNDYRHPIVTAKEVATLDLISEGRVELGVGAGWKKIDYEQSGLPMDPPKVRVDRMIEGIEVMRRAFAEGRSTSPASTTRSRATTGSRSRTARAARRCSWAAARPHAAVGRGQRRHRRREPVDPLG